MSAWFPIFWVDQDLVVLRSAWLVWILIERAFGFNFYFFKQLLIGFWLFVSSML